MARCVQASRRMQPALTATTPSTQVACWQGQQATSFRANHCTNRLLQVSAAGTHAVGLHTVTACMHYSKTPHVARSQGQEFGAVGDDLVPRVAVALRLHTHSGTQATLLQLYQAAHRGTRSG